MMSMLIWASGTPGTCTAQGFGIQVGFAVPLYNCSLCVYYLLVIVFCKDDNDIAVQLEWAMHLLPIIFGLSKAISGLVNNLFHSNSSFCWIEPSPFNCYWNNWYDCSEAQNAEEFQWKFAGYPLIAAFGFVLLAMATIFIKICRQESLMRSRYGAHNNRFDQSRAAAVQAVLYVNVFLFTYLFGFVIQIARFLSFDIGFWLHILNALFLPLQGSWNMLIFILPTYVRLRKRNADKPRYWALLAAIKFESIAYAPTPRRGRSVSTRSLARQGSGFFRTISKRFRLANGQLDGSTSASNDTMCPQSNHTMGPPSNEALNIEDNGITSGESN